MSEERDFAQTGDWPALHFNNPPRRVVSLVPSLTESLVELGLGEALVGITDFCVYPADKVQGLPRLGGPKNPRLEDILALAPDLILANQEENTRQAVEAMKAAGLTVWITFPCSVRTTLDLLWALAALFQDQAAAARVRALEKTVDWVQSAASERPSLRTFCPIWMDETGRGQRWWMTFNRHTYIHDLLQLLGGDNVFAGRVRYYPLEADLGLVEPGASGDRDTRYPRVTLAEVRAADPEVILLPSEPYSFEEFHRQELGELLAGTPAIRAGKVYLVDGSLLTWHGTRLARALQELPGLFE